jgi:hypothetical protein
VLAVDLRLERPLALEEPRRRSLSSLCEIRMADPEPVRGRGDPPPDRVANARAICPPCASTAVWQAGVSDPSGRGWVADTPPLFTISFRPHRRHAAHLQKR